MGVLEIAEAITAMKVKPKRSTLFVWHSGEEAGLVGSRFFTTNPTVPMDSVVAQINIDMIGRGRAEDLPGGGPDYVGVVGSFASTPRTSATWSRTSTKSSRSRWPSITSATIATLNVDPEYNNIYGRSDHFNYAKQGVPIAFFWTGLHGDYHQMSDEPEFIDYPHYARDCELTSRTWWSRSENGPRPL